MENLVFALVGVTTLLSLGWMGDVPGDAREGAHWLVGLAFFSWGILGRWQACRTLGALRKKYEEKALLDERTGALPRSRLMEAIEREMKAAKRKGTSLSVVMVEALNIMEINHKFDRLEGDLSLAAVAMGAQKCLRDTDYLGRSGGLTLCALLPDANAEQSMVVRARIAETLDGIVRSHARGEVRIRSRLIQKTWNGEDGAADFMAQAEGDLASGAAYE